MEEVFRNILVPIDGSLQSRISQEMAVFLSKLFRSQVTLLYVVSNELLTLPGHIYTLRESYVPISTATGQFPRTLSLPQTKEYVFPDEVIKEVTENYLQKGQTLLAESTSLFIREGLTVNEKLVEGTDIAETIITEAENGNYDLVVMGNSGSEESELDLHLGSVARKVSSSVKTPIMIVRKKIEIRKILIPVDGSVKEGKALQNASAIAKATGSRVVLLHVQETSLLRLKPEIKGFGLKILENASRVFEGMQLEQKLVSGDPANIIIQTAIQADVDLIVMSKGGRAALKDFFLGSVSDHVLHHATVPIFLVK
jgi:nucleotide-binding universal stress UspA family protein